MRDSAPRYEKMVQDALSSISSTKSLSTEEMPPSDILCSGKAPLPNFTCVSGIWTSASNVTLNSTLIISSDSLVSINGTLTLNRRANIEFMGLGSRLIVANCLVTSGYKHTVTFNLTKTSAPTHITDLIPYISTSLNCTDSVAKLEIHVTDGPYCRLTSVHDYTARNETLAISFESSKLNCILIYSIIGTVAGLLATTITITVASLFWMRRNRAEDYAKAFDAGATKPRMTGH